jgi:hypothetical protein
VVEWGKAPWTLRAYVVIALAGTVIVAVVVPSTPVAARLFFVAITAVVCFFLLRAVRWLWLLMIASILLGFVLGAVEGKQRWYGIAQGVVALILLLHPATRRFFQRRETPRPPSSP